MSLSRLAAKCRACPKLDFCDRKRMEALGTMPLPTVDSSLQSVSPEYDENKVDETIREITRMIHNQKQLLQSIRGR